MRVSSSVVLIPLFGVDVPASGKGIRLSSELSGTEMDNEIEMMQEFRPACLTTGEEFGGGEILKVLVIHDNVYRLRRAFEIMSPGVEYDKLFVWNG
jgi:hypothetical protein